jgi:hypothetical protein
MITKKEMMSRGSFAWSLLPCSFSSFLKETKYGVRATRPSTATDFLPISALLEKCNP